jgi:hypothetical protein
MRLERMRLQHNCRTITDGLLVHQHARGDVMFCMEPIADPREHSEITFSNDPEAAQDRARA